MDVTKPYKFIWFGDIHGPNPHKFTYIYMVSMGVSFADTGSEARYSSERFWCLSKKDSEIRGNEGKDLLRQSLCDHGCLR